MATPTLTLTAGQARALYEGLDGAVQSETDRSIPETISTHRKLRHHLELAEQLHAAEREAGCELGLVDTAAALRVIRDLIVALDETMEDDIGSLLDGPKCREDQGNWAGYASQHGEMLKRDSRHRQQLCEVLVELSIKRATEVERQPISDVRDDNRGEQNRAMSREFLGEEVAG